MLQDDEMIARSQYNAYEGNEVFLINRYDKIAAATELNDVKALIKEAKQLAYEEMSFYDIVSD